MQTFNIKGQYKSALTESKITDKGHFCFCVFRIHLFGRLKNFISVSLTELFIKENTFCEVLQLFTCYVLHNTLRME